MIEEALQYAGRGWRVFPVHSIVREGGGQGVDQGLGQVIGCTCRRASCLPSTWAKHPRIKKWQVAATTDPAKIAAWWRKWPDANIGVAAGDGLAVLDVDGAEQAAAVKAVLGDEGLPRTLFAATGRGFHLYFAGEIGASKFAESQGQRLLLRGAGGYVIAPPSWHGSGKQYQWVNSEALCALPERLRAFFQAADRTGANGSNAGLVLDQAPEWIRVRYQGLGGKGSENGTAGSASGGVTVASLAARAMILVREPWSLEEQTRVESALEAIPASCGRDAWLHVGMALHGLHWDRPDGTDIGFDIWDRWSASCPDKYSQWDVETRWRSFGGREGVTLGTLYHMAREAGWAGGVAVAPVVSFEGGVGSDSLQVSGGSQALVTTVIYPDAGGDAGAPAGTNGHHVNGFAAPRAVVFPDVSKDGDPRATLLNTTRAIEGMGVECKKDIFHNRMTVAGHVIEQWSGELSDDAVQMLRSKIRDIYGFDPGLLNCHDACTVLCLQNQFDPLLDYLDSLVWDGVRRIDTWLASYLGADDSKLNQAFGRLMLIAAVRRARKPGTKFDQIIVLEGPEGKDKSTALRVLAGGGDYFSDQPILTLSNRDAQEAVEGVWIHEIAELQGMRRADVEHVKAFVSREDDRARGAYQRRRVDIKRRVIFTATTNESEYLRAGEGNRRFWPVKVGEINTAQLASDRDQLWAEAAICEARGDTIVLDRSLWSTAGEAQLERVEHDSWEENIRVYLAQAYKKHDEAPNLDKDNRPKGEFDTSVLEVLLNALQMLVKDVAHSHMTRAAKTLKKLGFERYQKRVGNYLAWRYRLGFGRKPPLAGW